MAREPQTREINGHTYTVQMLDGSDSWKLLLKLTKMLGPSLGKLVGSGSINAIMDMDIGKSGIVAEAIDAFVTNVSEKELGEVIEKFKKNTLVDNKPLAPVFELHFQGDAITIMKWLVFALQAQYEGFSDALGSVGK